MCSPELTKGLCQVCTGRLTPETTHVDSYGERWDVHKGVCAIEAGAIDALPLIHRDTYWWYVTRIHNASSSEVRRSIVKALKKWIREIAKENHYWEGP